MYGRLFEREIERQQTCKSRRRRAIYSTARIVRRFTWKLLETKPKAQATLLEPAMNKTQREPPDIVKADSNEIHSLYCI